MQIGDIVVPQEGRGPLRSGAEWYASAVVVQVDPLVLVSKESDMRWQSTVQDRRFTVIGKASSELMSVVNRRLES